MSTQKTLTKARPDVRCKPLCLAIAALMASPLALAQSEAESLKPIEVTADRTSDSDAVVTEERIEQYQASDLEDVLAGQPEVAVGGSVGIAQKVYVRGIEDPLLNVTIDGATQAGALFHHTGRLAVEPELLKRVEVEAGAGRRGPAMLGGPGHERERHTDADG